MYTCTTQCRIFYANCGEGIIDYVFLSTPALWQRLRLTIMYRALHHGAPSQFPDFTLDLITEHNMRLKVSMELYHI